MLSTRPVASVSVNLSVTRPTLDVSSLSRDAALVVWDGVTSAIDADPTLPASLVRELRSFADSIFATRIIEAS